jgi:uncharacterized coiled-coil protein SlyX
LKYALKTKLTIGCLEMAEMADTPGSKDKYFEALDFIINVLKEHEQILDKSIHALATVTEQMGNSDELNGKVEEVDEKINLLQKQVTNLTHCFSTSQKEGLPNAAKKIEAPLQMLHSISQPTVQVGASMAMQCKQWVDFQALAMHAQTLSFSFKEAEKMFQADALRGNQLITYTGALPSISSILRTWLSVQLGMSERNIFEGSLGKPK